MRVVAEARNRRDSRRVFPPRNNVVEFIAGPFVECVDRIWEAKLGEYLSASDARRHLWHAYLASGLPTFRPRSAAAAKRLYDRLTHAPGKELAAQSYGECPPGLLQSLGRLGAEPRRPEIYRALVQILQRGGPSAKAVMHSAQLSDELIRAFATVPTGMASKRTIGLVVRGHISPGDLATFGWTLSRIRRLKDQEAYERVLTSTDPLAAVVQLLLQAAFPAPPWPGRLRPPTRDHRRRGT